jgi:O-antigen/teichoic acid export membrane protein
MNLLSIFDFGLVELGLITAALLGLASVFIYRARKAHKSGTTIQTKTAQGTLYSTKKLPYWKINDTYFAGVFIAAYVVFLVAVRNDYKGYDPKKHGVPKVQTDSTRKAVEDMITK